MAYTPEQKTQIVKQICDHISCGMSLRKALKAIPDPIGSETFYSFIDEDKEKSKQYAPAVDPIRLLL